MIESIKLLFTQFNDETFIVSLAVLLLTLACLLAYWAYNKKKFNSLSHQIPASVVKNYLDSIIQNSMSLKSNLFRGGGLDLGEVGIPVVVPVSKMQSNDGAEVKALQESLNQKMAENASLQAQLADKAVLVKDLEKKIAELEKIKAELQEKLAKIEGQSGDSTGLVLTLTAERDELQNQLKEFEIIKDDLANLKKLQEENAELKRQLQEAKGTPAAEPATPPKPAAVEEAPPVQEAPAAPPAPPEEQSADDLLSEFEKMLG